MFRHALVLLILVASLPCVPCFGGPPEKKDSAEAIARDLVRLHRRYVNSPPRSEKELRQARAEAAKLTSRTMRLPDWRSPEARELRDAIRAFKKRLSDTPVAQTQQRRSADRLRRSTSTRKAPTPTSKKTVRKQAPKKETLVAIKGPTLSEGGHSERGLAYLKDEVERFGKRYRMVRGKDTVEGRGANRFVGFSRENLERSIKSSLRTAIRQIETDSYNPSITYIHEGGGIVLDNYTPQQNLQWAYDVATVAVRFESLVYGNSTRWRQWQTKIRNRARQYNLELTNRAVKPSRPEPRRSKATSTQAAPKTESAPQRAR